MKLSKKQIIYGSVLALAGVAWVIDAAFFGPPTAASAAQSDADPAAVGAKSVAGQVVVADGSEHLLTMRLQKWSTDHSTELSEIPDVFQPTPKAAPTVVATPQTRPAEDKALVFNRQHRLIAIVLEGAGGYALIDGRVLRVGQVIDDAELIGLTPRLARFSAQGRLFDMPLTADVSNDR
jgi:hypothetical protein